VTAAGTDLALGTIGQILVPVDDIEASTAFYRDVLRVPLLFTYPGLAFFDAGGVRLYLAAPESDAFRGRVTIYFRVDDIAGAVATLEGRGVEFLGPTHVVHREASIELWMAFFRDPAGNNLALMSEVPTGR
jgi:predicted enzyme related to lactoylglutathione lyase